MGYVARILNEYFPETGQPAGLGDNNQRAAAVQSAVWYFSDRYVLNAGSAGSAGRTLHDAVAAIVDHVLAAGPLIQPPPPSLTLSPSALSGPAGSVLGPFQLSTTAGSAVVGANGAQLYSDPAATVPIADGSTVASGQALYARSGGPAVAVIYARSTATVPTGNVYLYDGNSAGVNDAQKLILARSATLSTTVQATAEFQAPGSLVITKTVAGPAAGKQDRVVIRATCDGTALVPDFTIPAGSAAGGYSQTYPDLPAGSTCTVEEVADGHTSTVAAEISGSGQKVVVPAGGPATVDLTDTYTDAPGTLVVDKSLTGDAGAQGEVRVSVRCGGVDLAPELVVPAGTPAGTVSHEYTGLAAGTSCTVTETANGSTETIEVEVAGDGQSVTIPAGGAAEASLVDRYHQVSGSIEVTKTVTGAAAGRQGQVEILVSCGGPVHEYSYVLPAGTPAGSLPRRFDGIPAGSTCRVTETVDGHTSSVTATVVGSGQEVLVSPASTGAVTITDTYAEASTGPSGATTTTTALPATGSSSGPLAILGAVAVLAGAGMVWASRRRSTDRGRASR